MATAHRTQDPTALDANRLRPRKSGTRRLAPEQVNYIRERYLLDHALLPTIQAELADIGVTLSVPMICQIGRGYFYQDVPYSPELQSALDQLRADDPRSASRR